MLNFIKKYFLEPIEYSLGYNWVNTITYALLAVSILYLIYRFIEKSKTKIDKYFCLSIIPFTFLGILIRVQVDYGLLKPTLWTVTPGAWIIPLVLWLVLFYLLGNLKKIILSGFLILFISLLFFKVFIYNFFIIIYLGLLLLTFFFIYKENFLVLAFLGQLTDALGSYLGLKYGLLEEHVLPNIIINSLGIEAFFITKLATTIFALYLIKHIVTSDNLRKFIYLAIFVLGFGPGTRNWLILSYEI